MSMGFESMLQSTPTGSDIALEMGDIKLQYNAALDDLRVVSASFESYMNACERYFALCDCVEANEGMLEPAVLDFVNHNGALSEALGVSFAQEGFFTKIKNAFVSDDKFMFAAVKNGMGFNTPSGLSHGYEFYDSRKEAIIKQWQNETIKFIDSDGKPDEASPPELIIRSKEEIEAMERERERRQVIERSRGSVAASPKVPEYA